MGTLFNIIEVAKSTEKFYLSELNTSTILVNFNPPINDIISFKVVRKSSYQKTLNYILANIYVYISICNKVQYNNNGKTLEFVAIGISNRNNLVDLLHEKYFRNYIMGNEFLGSKNFI